MPEATYNKEWFKRRAFESIKKISDGNWDYSDSLLLYLPSEVDHYATLQNTDSPYYTIVTKPEREYLFSIAKDVATQLPTNFEFIDLGPGTEHKEQFLFDELAAQGKKFTYIPIDINTDYLELAETHATQQGITVRTIQSSFEELAEKLGKSTLPRFVSLGLTFSNYAPQDIIKLLRDIAGENGFVFINAHMRDRTNMVELQQAYAIDAVHMADEKLKLIGLDPDKDLTPREATDDVKVWTSLLTTNTELDALGIKKYDKLLVFQSLRYTKETLIDELEKTGCSFTLLDTGSPFIATLLHTKP